MGPPGGGRNPVTPRFIRHFNVVAMNTFNDETMVRIFSTLMTTFLRANDFAPDYFTAGNYIVSATMDIYKEAMKNLLPTPAKSHYVFNLRDFSRVILGICLVRKQEVTDKRVMTRLWVHEVMRVFYDRLIDDKDRQWLFSSVSANIKDQFKDTIDVVFEHLANGGKGGKLTEGDLRSLMFGDYMNPDADPEDRRYEEVKSIDDFYTVAEQCMEEYNNTHKTRMHLVIFRLAKIQTFIAFFYCFCNE